MVSIPINSTVDHETTNRCCRYISKAAKWVLIGLLVMCVIGATVGVVIFMMEEPDVNETGPSELSDYLLKSAKKIDRDNASHEEL